MAPATIIKPVAPDIEALKAVVKDGLCITVFSPFYTAAGLFLFKSAIKGNTSVREINFNCRLTKSDWIQGGIDPIALLQMCRNLGGRVKVNIAHNDVLHAKAYYSERIGLIGSANLTQHGFGNSLEFMLMISGDILASVKLWLNLNIGLSLHKITNKELEEFISQNIEEVNRSKRAIKNTLIQKLPLSYAPVDRFIDYCVKLNDSAAKVVVSRFKGESHLSGHVENLYYASYQFFDKNRDLIEPIARISPNVFHLRNTPYLDIWINFIQGTDIQDMPSVGFRKKSTRTYLPTVFGGKTTGGGGGRGSLDRLLPLVARFIIENQSS